jgi:Phosphoribosyl transferase domain
VTGLEWPDRIVELSDRLVTELVPPPTDGPGICSRCRTWNDAEPEPECSNCAEVRSLLGAEPLRISAVSLYRKPSILRDWLTQYKGRLDDVDPFVPAYRDIVAAMLARFHKEHGNLLQRRLGGYDRVLIVPSTSRPPPHPLESLVAATWTSTPVLRALKRGTGDLGFRKPAKDGYVVTEPTATNRRVLIVDDVYTTGSRLNSAAYALRDAGFEIAGAFVIARRVNVDFDARAAEMWNRQSAKAFRWDTSPVVATP